jgi:hypothetical protein
MQLLPRVKNFMAAFDILISGAPEAGITSPHTNGVHNQDDFDTEEGSQYASHYETVYDCITE